MINAEIAGRKRIRLRRCVLRNSIAWLLCHQQEVQQPADHKQNDQREKKILLDASRLNGAKIFAEPPSHVCGTIAEELIDDGQIKVIADRASDSAGGWSKQMKDAIDEAFVHPFGDEYFREPDGGFDEHNIVKFIDIPLVLE